VSALFIFRIDCRLYSLLLNDLSEAEKRNCRPLKENVVSNHGSREFLITDMSNLTASCHITRVCIFVSIKLFASVNSLSYPRFDWVDVQFF
jgi:hypothetical protein